MKRWLLAALLLAGGCAELTRPLPPEPPFELAGRIAANPVPLILDAAAADFAQAGAGLAGRPVSTALAAARLEWIAGEFRPNRRLARLQESYAFGAQRAVIEARGALGIAPDATPEAAQAALVAVARGLNRGDQPGASAAFANPVFLQQGRSPLSRFTEPGVFPDAALATIAVRDEAARLLQAGEGTGLVVFDSRPIGFSTTGLGSPTDR